MSQLLLSFALIMCTSHLGSAAEPAPAPPTPPTAGSVPPVVRLEAAKLAQANTLDSVEEVEREQRTVYVVRWIDAATKEAVSATFKADGSLISLERLAKHEVPNLSPLPGDATPPHRIDHRDADPATRRGLEPSQQP